MHNDTLIFIGRSGSGKGTQISLLKEYLKKQSPDVDILHFESGAHFRSFIKQDGYTSKHMREIIAGGSLAPDFITEWLMVDEFVKNLTPQKTLILDGFPRTLNQAWTLDSAMDYYQRNFIKVIHIDVSEVEVRKRMINRGRSDDKEIASINKRIKWYNDNVLPVLDYYRNDDQYQVIDINGELSVDEVYQSIIQKLEL